MFVVDRFPHRAFERVEVSVGRFFAQRCLYVCSGQDVIVTVHLRVQSSEVSASRKVPLRASESNRWPRVVLAANDSFSAFSDLTRRQYAWQWFVIVVAVCIARDARQTAVVRSAMPLFVLWSCCQSCSVGV